MPSLPFMGMPVTDRITALSGGRYSRLPFVRTQGNPVLPPESLPPSSPRLRLVLLPDNLEQR